LLLVLERHPDIQHNYLTSVSQVSTQARGDNSVMNIITSLRRKINLYIILLVTRQEKSLGTQVYRLSANNKQGIKQENRHAVSFIRVDSCK
jgi:hypothetical protein